MGFIFLDKHLSEFNGEVEELKLGSPEVKRTLVEVPFSDKILDFTGIATGGDPPMGKRKIKCKITMAANTREELFQTFGKLSNHLYGGSGRLILDEDKDFYYKAAISKVSELENELTFGKFTVEFLAEGRKYSLLEVSEIDWDTFDFNSDILQELTFDVDGEKLINIFNNYLPYIPLIRCSSDILAIKDNSEISLKAGDNINPLLSLKTGENHITLKGTSTVEFFYRKVSV